MKTVIWIILLGIIFLFVFKFVRKVLMIKKAFKDAIHQSQQFGGQQQGPYSNRTQEQTPSQNTIEKPRFNIEAETIDFEIIEEKNEK